jgi:23S rRNA pseudouridine2605 synthase
MRKDNSRRDRSSSSREKKSGRFEKSSFRKKDFDNKPGEKKFEKKIFSDERKKEEPVSFEKKKKYSDRSAKIAKNKRRLDFGQSFINKDEKRDNEGFEKKREGGNSFWDRKKKERFGENRERKPFQKSWNKSETGDRTDKNRSDNPDSYRDRKRFVPGNRKPKIVTRKQESHSEDGVLLIRLNKYIANAGICSRREADDMITAGLISVNGNIITTLGTKISPSDVVKYNNETLRRERNVYVLLNKPKDYITTVEDPQNRNTVMNLVANACKERIYPVGRLDRNTTGVLLFTNDGELTKKLTHPASNVKKIYHVELDRNVKLTDLEKIKEGIELEDGIAQVDEIDYDHPSDGSHVGIELHSGKNRIVRRIFETLGYEVHKLDRVVFAGLTKKDLPRGRWRFLTGMEVGMLKMLTGSKNKKIVD